MRRMVLGSKWLRCRNDGLPLTMMTQWLLPVLVYVGYPEKVGQTL